MACVVSCVLGICVLGTIALVKCFVTFSWSKGVKTPFRVGIIWGTLTDFITIDAQNWSIKRLVYERFGKAR